MLNKMLVLLSAATCLLSSSAFANDQATKIPPRAMRFPSFKKRPEGYKFWEDEQPQEFFFYTKLDHFDADGKSSTFKMRYLVDDTYWDPQTGPILFYAGNEGDIYSFYDNVGFMT